MRHGHMRQLAQKSKLDGALNRLLKAGADHRIAMGAEQHRCAVF